MIPTDHIAFTNDGHAWLVTGDLVDGRPYLKLFNSGAGYTLKSLDRPCDTCDGQAKLAMGMFGALMPCPDCIGTGRHNFKIEVEQYAYGEEYTGEPVICGTTMRTHRVLIVPGMVLPIVEDDGIGDVPTRCALIDSDTGDSWMWGESHDDIPITLPPAAEPGMWAVKLQVVL